MSGPARLLIADKNPLVLKGLEAIVDDDPRFELVAALNTGAGFVEQAASSSFDVGVIGWLLPDMDGGEVMRQLKAMESIARMVIYTGSRNPDTPRLVMKYGGYGFCSKSDPPEVLLDVIYTVSLGRMSFPYVDVTTLHEDPLSELTSRERELLSALASGWTNQQIANRIGISENTVKFHLKNLYEKLDVRNRAMAVALYMANRNSD